MGREIATTQNCIIKKSVRPRGLFIAYLLRDRLLPICSVTSNQESCKMPLAKIHVLEGQYDEPRLSNVSKAVQDALMSVLKVPPDDFFQIIHELPRNRFLHTPSFVGMK